MQTTAQSENLDFNKVWLMFQETRNILDEMFQETTRNFRKLIEYFKY